MNRYVIRPSAVWVDELEANAPDPQRLTVFEDDDPRPTGLFDSRGNEIFRVPVRHPMGYVCRKP